MKLLLVAPSSLGRWLGEDGARENPTELDGPRFLFLAISDPDKIGFDYPPNLGATIAGQMR